MTVPSQTVCVPSWWTEFIICMRGIWDCTFYGMKNAIQIKYGLSDYLSVRSFLLSWIRHQNRYFEIVLIFILMIDYDILDSSHGQLTQTLSNPRDVCCFLSLHSPRVMMCGQSPGGGCGGRVWSSEQWTSANLGAGARKCSRARGTSGSPAPVPPPSELGWSWQQLITGLLTSLLSLNVLTTWVFF